MPHPLGVVHTPHFLAVAAVAVVGHIVQHNQPPIVHILDPASPSIVEHNFLPPANTPLTHPNTVSNHTSCRYQLLFPMPDTGHRQLRKRQKKSIQIKRDIQNAMLNGINTNLLPFALTPRCTTSAASSQAPHIRSYAATPYSSPPPMQIAQSHSPWRNRTSPAPPLPP